MASLYYPIRKYIRIYSDVYFIGSRNQLIIKPRSTFSNFVTAFLRFLKTGLHKSEKSLERFLGYLIGPHYALREGGKRGSKSQDVKMRILALLSNKKTAAGIL